MKDLLQDMIKNILGIERTKIGDVPQEIAVKFDDVKKKRKQVESDLEDRMEELAEQLKAEFKEKDEALEDEHKAIWQEVYTHFDIAGDQQLKPYHINNDDELMLLEKIEKSEHPVQ